MISRLFITLALASSLCLIAVPETPLVDHEESKIYKTTAALLLTAASATAAYVGITDNNPTLTSCGFGLLTGLGCALFERQCENHGIVLLSWSGEGIIREESIKNFSDLSQEATGKALGGARVGSWVAYLSYYAAVAADKETKD